MGQVPVKCSNLKVANSFLFRWWCSWVCGGLTGGRLCAQWCKIAERYGMWTLLITLPAPVLALYIIFKYMILVRLQ
jgi:hypothetical protein